MPLVLDQNSLQLIHAASMEILGDAGMELLDEKARALLGDAGATVKGSRVFIPGELVKQSLYTAPSGFTIFDREGTATLELGAGRIYFGPGSDLPYFVDVQTGHVRRATLSDVSISARVCEALEGIDFVMSLALPSDVNPFLTDVYSAKSMICGCRKPFVSTTTSLSSTKAIWEMGAAVRGGPTELSSRPFYVIYTQPTSPLRHSEESLSSLLFCAEHRIPVTYASGAIAGGTAPVTMAGCLAMVNAETLTGLVLHQLKQPGSPFIYGLIPSSMDMRSGISIYGGVELPLMHFAAAQLGRHYGLPVFGTAGCTDSNRFDSQAGTEATLSIISAALCGSDLIHDSGYMSAGMVGSLPMLVLDNEIISMVKRFTGGIAVNQETLALETLRQVGPGGHFLQTDHTFDHFREECWLPSLFDRTPYSVWAEREGPTLSARIGKRLRTILSGEGAGLGEETVRELDAIVDAYEKTFEGRQNRV
jgi:trimethylamine--corrinoid protein Co-methyltransferase